MSTGAGDWWVEIDMGMNYTGVHVDGSVIRIPFGTRKSAQVCVNGLKTRIRPKRLVIPGSVVTGDDHDQH